MKRREHLEEDWMNLLFIQFKRTNWICYSLFGHVTTAQLPIGARACYNGAFYYTSEVGFSKFESEFKVTKSEEPLQPKFQM